MTQVRGGSARMKVVSCLLAACFGVCHADGASTEKFMGVIYAVPGLIGVVFLVSAIVMLGMLCSRSIENRRKRREEKNRAKSGRVNPAMAEEAVEMNTERYREIEEVNVQM